MKRHLAHTLRRTARRMIAWSNRLDRPRAIVTLADCSLADESAARDIARHMAAQARMAR